MDFETFRDILWEDNDDYVAIDSETVIDTSRWHVMYEQHFKQESSGKVFCASWSSGATEYQDSDGTYWSFVEVEPKEIVKTIYKVKQGGESHNGSWGY